jgi:hypothetical protein
MIDQLLSGRTPMLTWERQVSEYREKVYHAVIANLHGLEDLWKMERLMRH